MYASQQGDAKWELFMNFLIGIFCKYYVFGKTRLCNLYIVEIECYFKHVTMAEFEL